MQLDCAEIRDLLVTQVWMQIPNRTLLCILDRRARNSPLISSSVAPSSLRRSTLRLTLPAGSSLFPRDS